MESGLNLSSYKAPSPLKHGDTIGVCAPSGAFELNRFDKGINVLKSMGFNIYIPDEIYHKKRYMAGDDEIRADVVNSLFKNPDIKGIICARGGFGALRTLNYIDYELISSNPKLFVGFSDITALLTAVSEKSGIQVVHGPVVTSLVDADQATLDSLYHQLTSCSSHFNQSFSFKSSEKFDKNLEKVSNPNLEPDFCKFRTLRQGSALERLTGGNLSTLCHLIGTKFQPDLDDSILFIEDIGEAPYKIDRMLSQMKLAGMFDKVRAVVAGTFERCGYKKSEGSQTNNSNAADSIYDNAVIDEIILEIFDNPACPIIADIDAGHGITNLSLRFGCLAEIDV